MAEILRFIGVDLEVVLEKIMATELLIEKAMVKTHRQVSVETEIRYFFDEKQWEGLVIVNDAEEDRHNNKKDIT